MEQLPALGTQISKTVAPTLKVYERLLLANADTIRSVPKQTYRYGSHERQQLDVYLAPKRTLKHGRQPVILFLYGGGLVQGHKTLPGYADDLCHANMASFFALRCGYNFVAADYRLVYSHEAKFPSGGEDVTLAVEWLVANAETALGPEPVDLFIMGNSAGGVHLSTFLLDQTFTEAVSKVSSAEKVRLRGAILLSVPFHFQLASSDRADILKTYFGDPEANCPLGLLKSSQEQGDLAMLQSGLKVLILNGELDPQDEIMIPRDDFVRQWLSTGSTTESRKALAVDIMPRHNHISPFCSLGTGIEEEEAWGFQVSAFCDNARTFKI